MTGDAGTTSLVGGQRVSKADVRLESYGTIDELNSFIGLLASQPGLPADVTDTLHFVQNKLFNVGAYLATDNSDTGNMTVSGLGDADIKRIEHTIDLLDSQVPPLCRFLLPRVPQRGSPRRTPHYSPGAERTSVGHRGGFRQPPERLLLRIGTFFECFSWCR